MKIRRISVREYKNVSVDVVLHAELITLLVGQNGMGKSNLIEILLLVFDELNQLYKGRKPAEEEKLTFDYSLEYECRGRIFRVRKEDDKHFFWELTVGGDGQDIVQACDIKHIILPSQIVGYYSGENKRVRTLVAKHIKREESSKRRRYSKGSVERLIPKKLFFAENRHSMAVLT